jgi:hypothetical protein
VVQAAALRPWGRIPFAWPRDGRRETLEGAGIALANQYKAQGLEMLHEHAQFEDGSVSVEAGLMEMLSRMETGRFKVFKDLHDWFEEFRLYHRKDGRVVKEHDDLMSATRYARCVMQGPATFTTRWTPISSIRPDGTSNSHDGRLRITHLLSAPARQGVTLFLDDARGDSHGLRSDVERRRPSLTHSGPNRR